MYRFSQYNEKQMFSKKKINPQNLSPEHTSVFLYFQKLETDAMKSRSVHNKNKTSPQGCFVLFFCIIFYVCACSPQRSITATF